MSRGAANLAGQGRISHAPIVLASNNAARLTPAEIAQTITPLRAAARALRDGVAPSGIGRS